MVALNRKHGVCGVQCMVSAALALAQLGREGEATKEMQGIARRAPGSADMRAALAALYWSQVWSTDGSG